MKIATSKKLISLLLISILLFSLVLTGCNKEGAQVKKNMPQIAYYANFSEPILDWDPSVMFSNGIVVLSNVYETLLRYDSENDVLIPMLATDYTKSEDGLTWTFNIRQDVKFHDGTDLNAEAVKFSIDRTMTMNKGGSYIWEAVKEINVLEEYKVEFKLDYPAPIDLIASAGYASFIMSPTAVKENGDEWFQKGNEAGTGPYKLQKFTMGDEVVLTKNDDYWKGWEGKNFDKVVIKKVSESSSRRQMITKGEADITYGLPYEDVESLKENSNVAINVEPSYQNMIGCFNIEKEPLNNKLVRQALSYAFPYDDVVKYAKGGYAQQSTGVVPNGLWGHSNTLFQYKYDIDKAKELLAEAGYPDGGLNLTYTYTSGDEAGKKTAELYKSELAKINVYLDVRGMPWDSQWEMAKSTKPEDRQDIFTLYWWPDYASPISWMYNLYHSEDEILFNLSYVKDTALDGMIEEADALTATDREKAEEVFVKAQEDVIENAYTMFMYDKQVVWVQNASFKGHKGNPAYPNVVFFYDTYRE